MAKKMYPTSEEIGILSENKNGWKKELTLVTEDNGKVYMDLRDWSAKHKKKGEGVILTIDEAVMLYKHLGKCFPSIALNFGTVLR